MVLLGYIASFLIGVSLGLIGGGGSILTVPVLVYLFHFDPMRATAHSLFIVGFTSLTGSISRYRLGQVDLTTALLFGIPSIMAVYITRAFVVPLIPAVVIETGGLVVTRNLFMMLLFALLLVLAAIFMLSRSKDPAVTGRTPTSSFAGLFLQGTLTGLITGLVGVGGGFLIIPALVVLRRLSMNDAIGTSLVIIAANSLFGFTGDLGKTIINWPVLFTITALAVAGIFAGNRLNGYIPAVKLKKGFGWFVLLMGLYIIIKELFFPGKIPS